MISRSAHRRKHQMVMRRRGGRRIRTNMFTLKARVEVAEAEQKKIVRGITGRFVNLRTAYEGLKRYFGHRTASPLPA